jgi:hypothetical protein
LYHRNRFVFLPGTSCECRRHGQFELIVDNPDCRRARQIVPLGTGKQT